MSKKPKPRPDPDIIPFSIEWCKNQFHKTGNPYYVWIVIFETGIFDMPDNQEITNELNKLINIIGIKDNINATIPAWIAEYLQGTATRMMVCEDIDAAYILGLRPPRDESSDEYYSRKRGIGFISQARQKITKELAKIEVSERIDDMVQSGNTIDGAIVYKICAEVAQDMKLMVDAGTVMDWYYRRSDTKPKKMNKKDPVP